MKESRVDSFCCCWYPMGVHHEMVSLRMFFLILVEYKFELTPNEWCIKWKRVYPKYMYIGSTEILRNHPQSSLPWIRSSISTNVVEVGGSSCCSCCCCCCTCWDCHCSSSWGDRESWRLHVGERTKKTPCFFGNLSSIVSSRKRIITCRGVRVLLCGPSLSMIWEFMMVGAETNAIRTESNNNNNKCCSENWLETGWYTYVRIVPYCIYYVWTYPNSGIRRIANRPYVVRNTLRKREQRHRRKDIEASTERST